MSNSKDIKDEANLPPDYYTCKASLAFDQWVGCLSVGKQLSSYYRYGEKTSCSKYWKKLKLCMKVKVRSEEAGNELMREFRQQEEQKQKAQPNVLDVWTVRETPPSKAESSDSGPQMY